MIEIRNLTKKYRELTVIDNFCHSFDGGKVYGIMGENGAGKSTLFRCIAGIESYDGSVVVNENKQMIEQLNEKFALPLQRYASRYSLGMKKRLMLLTLMLQDNDIVIMDEPFNGIDLAGTIILRQWLKDLKAQGRCVILSSHIVAAIADICDEMTYIHQGKAVCDFSGMSAASIEQYIMEEFLSSHAPGQV